MPILSFIICRNIIYENMCLPEFKNHIAEIQQHGFDTILFCITETDMLYNLETFKQFKVHAALKGMACWANF